MKNAVFVCVIPVWPNRKLSAFKTNLLHPSFTLKAEAKFDVHRALHLNIYISVVKPTRYIKFSNLFYWSNTVHVSGGLSVHHQELKTVHTAVKQILLSAYYRHMSNIYC